MSKFYAGLLAFGMIVAQASAANAVVCARGVYRAGCATRHGAVVTHRHVVHRHCYYRRGVRVCR